MIEGLQSSGKTTLINRLKVITRGTAITSLSDNLVEIRYIFSSLDVPESVLSALDHTFNYFMAHRIVKHCINQPIGHLVILEQYYHAICARTVCSNLPTDTDFKALDSSAFEWPIDLPIPHLVSRKIYSPTTIAY